MVCGLDFCLAFGLFVVVPLEFANLQLFACAFGVGGVGGVVVLILSIDLTSTYYSGAKAPTHYRFFVGVWGDMILLVAQDVEGNCT